LVIFRMKAWREFFSGSPTFGRRSSNFRITEVGDRSWSS
jgi:hypothetical protein